MEKWYDFFIWLILINRFLKLLKYFLKILERMKRRYTAFGLGETAE